jgi:hypothetical protein
MRRVGRLTAGLKGHAGKLRGNVTNICHFPDLVTKDELVTIGSLHENHVLDDDTTWNDCSADDTIIL